MHSTENSDTFSLCHYLGPVLHSSSPQTGLSLLTWQEILLLETPEQAFRDGREPGSLPGWGLYESLQAHLPVSILPGSHHCSNGPHQSELKLPSERVRTRIYLFMTNV